MRGIACATALLVVLGALLPSCGGDGPSDAQASRARLAKQKKAKKKRRSKPRRLRKVAALLEFAPVDSVAVFHLPDVKRAREALQATALADIWREREVQRALAGPIDAAMKLLRRLPFSDALQYDKVISQLSGELLVAFAAPDRVCAALDLGNAYLEVHRLVRSYTHTHLALERVGGLDVFTYKQPQSNAVGDTPIRLCFSQGRLLIGVGEKTLDDMLYAADKTLLDHPRFATACESSFGERADYRLFIDTARLLELADPFLDDRGRRAIELLGVDKIHTMVIAGHMDEREFVDRFAVLTDGKNPVAAKLLSAGKPTRETLALVPDIVENFTHFRLDAVGAVGLVKQLAELADARSTAGFHRALRQADESLGMPLEKFLAAFDSSWLLMTMPHEESEAPTSDPTSMLSQEAIGSSVLVVKVREPELVAQVLAHAVAKVPAISAQKVSGLPAFGLTASAESAPGADPLLVLKDDLLIASLDRRSVFRYLERQEQSIVRNPSFEFRWRAMPDDVSMVSYTDLRPLVERLLPMLASMLPMIADRVDDGGTLPFEMPQLPAAKAINQHLSPITSYAVVRDEGLFFEARSPIGSTVIVAPVIGVVAAAVLPNLMDRRQKPVVETGPAEPTKRRDPRPRQPGDEPPERVTVSTDEASTIYALRSMVTAQQEFQRGLHIDGDRDGTGEFGTFAELAGAVPLRGSRRTLSPAIITSTFSRIDDGLVTRRGHHLRLYLPDANGAPIAEAAQGGAPSAVDPKASAAAWAVLAWPSDDSKSKRTFYVDHAGTVYVTEQPFRGRAKAPDIAPLLQTENDMRSGIVKDGKARDGSAWFKTK